MYCKFNSSKPGLSSVQMINMERVDCKPHSSFSDVDWNKNHCRISLICTLFTTECVICDLLFSQSQVYRFTDNYYFFQVAIFFLWFFSALPTRRRVTRYLISWAGTNFSTTLKYIIRPKQITSASEYNLLAELDGFFLSPHDQPQLTMFSCVGLSWSSSRLWIPSRKYYPTHLELLLIRYRILGVLPWSTNI